MNMYLSNGFDKSIKELFLRLVSLICVVLMLWVSPLPALAGNLPSNLEQTANGDIVNHFYDGPSKEALAAALAGTLAGTAAGATGAVAVVSAAGTAGLSAAGLTSGLAAVGTIAGGGMAAGLTVAAALPVAGAVAVGGAAYVVVSLVQKFVNESKDSKQENSESQN
jgi:hypothetical protein